MDASSINVPAVLLEHVGDQFDNQRHLGHRSLPRGARLPQDPQSKSRFEALTLSAFGNETIFYLPVLGAQLRGI